MFVSASNDTYAKVWNFNIHLLQINENDINTTAAVPHLIKCLPHPDVVRCAKYSKSGLILTACDDNVLRIYSKEPLFSLCWHFRTSSRCWCVAWSPSNRLCALTASFESGPSFTIQVWDSAFQMIFKRQQNRLHARNGVVFASNNILMCAGGNAHKVHWYHISKPKVIKMFEDTDVLPFCMDVLKIIREYLPYITRVTIHELSTYVGAVATLSSDNDCVFKRLFFWTLEL